MQKNVSCNIKLNETAIKQLERAQITALEKTAEFIHTDVVQSQTIPFDVPTEKKKRRARQPPEHYRTKSILSIRHKVK